jgi:hypothetical protein
MNRAESKKRLSMMRIFLTGLFVAFVAAEVYLLHAGLVMRGVL